MVLCFTRCCSVTVETLELGAKLSMQAQSLLETIDRVLEPRV